MKQNSQTEDGEADLARKRRVHRIRLILAGLFLLLFFVRIAPALVTIAHAEFAGITPSTAWSE